MWYEGFYREDFIFSCKEIAGIRTINSVESFHSEVSMARITVEDCLKRIPNRFEMVKLAAKRARQIALDGREPTIDSGDDKATVVALREIAAGTVTQDNIQEFNFDIFEEELSEQLTSDSET